MTAGGWLAEFDSAEALAEAIRAARREGYDRLDAYTPSPQPEVSAALGEKKSRLPLACLLGGLGGGIGGYCLQWWTMASNYPFRVSGRPYQDVPAFIPVTFEMTILGAALATFFALFWSNGLPRPYHPVFDAPAFDRASIDRFFLAVPADDPAFSESGTAEFLDRHGATSRYPLRRAP